METFSALLALYEGNPPVTGGFPSQKPGNFDVFFDLRLNKGWTNNRGAGDLRHHHAHYDVTVVGNGHLECPVARHNVETQMSFWKKFRHLLQRKQLSFWQLILEQWWRHQMELFSALLAIWGGNSPVTGEFPAQRSVTRSFDTFFDLRLNKSLSEQSWGWWFETPWRPLWRHCNALQCFRVSVSSSLMCNRTPGRCFEKENLHP